MKSKLHYIQITYIVTIAIMFSLKVQTVQTSRARKTSNFARSLPEVISKTEKEEKSARKTKQAPTTAPKLKTEIVQKLEKLVKTVEGKPSMENDDEACNKESCAQLKKENIVLKKAEVLKNMMLKPAYPCDEWRQESRLCFLKRNVGNTVTFVLATPPPEKTGRVTVEWRQEYATTNPDRFKTYNINPKYPPWNMVIGSGGYELRVSPITEIDAYENFFTAVVHFQYGTPVRKLHFAIRALVVELGPVYPGATMTLHVPSFISLPQEGMTFKWELERDLTSLVISLPSNMRPSPSRASVRVSELRKDQEGIVLCSVYTNLGVLIGGIGFNIVRVESDNNQLVFVDTHPLHRSKSRKKRSPQFDEPQEPLNEPQVAAAETISHAIHRNRKTRYPRFDESLAYFKDSIDSDQEVINVTTDFHLQEKERQLPLTPRYRNKRQDGEAQTTQEQDYDLSMVTESKMDDPNMKDEFEDESESQYRSFELQNELKAPQVAAAETINHAIHRNRKTRYPLLDESPDYLKDSEDSEQAVTNVGTDVYLQGKVLEPPLTPIYRNKRQNDENPSTEEADYDPVVEQLNDYGEYYDEYEPPVGSQNELNSGTPNQKSYFGDFGWVENRRFEEEALAIETPKPRTTKRLSFLERRRQAILDRLRGNEPRRKQLIPEKKLPTTTELVDEEEDLNLPPLQERDKLAMLLSKCEKDSECSLKAVCVKRRPGRPGFCRCLPDFEGNGVFCWENGKWMI
ncbi:hypothetical protein AVEN_124566-1 [Araneus ventricosus]|uniref:Uncharacterized protein n=1 Tax=Araneus ventricosus TaxID=182803 RepID=A0A4Y2KHQ6_ARAVE|nr:hypothetical protein AVEN_124566-1 [Araneus ventricosus]